jgi:hypothetical protein
MLTQLRLLVGLALGFSLKVVMLLVVGACFQITGCGDDDSSTDTDTGTGTAPGGDDGGGSEPVDSGGPYPESSAPGGDGGGGSEPVDSGGPYLEKSGGGILHCGDITWGNGQIVSWVDWGIIHATNVGQSGIADVTVTVTDGTSSYVEHEQFSMLSGVTYDLSVGVPMVPKTSTSKPNPWPVLKAVVSLPGAPTDITLIDDVPTWNTTALQWIWNEPTGPSTTTLDPPPCQ